jgi:23S rRNA maturation-related 3'-5' exoribonuclease YhaM
MNKEEIREKICIHLEVTNRKGIENLIKWMDDNGFFTAPCSGQYHLAVKGGLAEHSLNVFHTMIDFAKAAYGPLSEEIQKSIAIVSLLHDLGKAGQFGKPNYVPTEPLKSGKPAAKPYVTNPDLIYVPHEIRSIQIASQFIELTEDESFAMLQHNGMYGDLKYSLQGKETPLQMLLHFADMWCSRVVEA